MFLLGVAIFLFSLGFSVILLGGQVSDFIDFAALVFIVGPILAVLIATRSLKVFCAGLKAAAFPKENISEKMRRQAVSLFRMLSKTAVIVGALVTLISLFNMLVNLNFSDAGGIATFGINIAASLTSLIYGLLLMAAVFEPVVFILKKRRDTGRRS